MGKKRQKADYKSSGERGPHQSLVKTGRMLHWSKEKRSMGKRARSRSENEQQTDIHGKKEEQQREK